MVVGTRDCMDACPTDNDILHGFDFCNKAIVDRLSPTQKTCLENELCGVSAAATLDINGAPFVTIPSGDTYDLDVVNSDDDAVGVSSSGDWVIADSTVRNNATPTWSDTVKAEGTITLAQGKMLDSDGTTTVLADYKPNTDGFMFTAASCPPCTSRGWVRNPDWLTFPDLYDGDNCIYILSGVKNGVNNFFAFKTTSSGDYTVDLYNDGTTITTHASNSQANFDLDYSKGTNEITSNGDNYKQVITKITGNFLVPTFNVVHSGSSNGMATRILSVKMASQTINDLSNCFSSYQNAKHSMFEEFEFCGTCNVTNLKNVVAYCRNIGSFIGNFSSCTGWQGSFNFCSLNSVENITTGGGFFRQTLNTALITQIFNQDFFKNATDFNRTLYNAAYLKYLGTPSVPLDLTGANVYSETFRNGSALIHAFFQNAQPTNLDRTFYACSVLETILGLDCSSLTSLNNPFFNNFSLSKLSMSNMTLSFSLENCNFNRQGLVDVFNDLATATSTITVTDNPGVPDLTPTDIAIATGKGWTVTT